MIESSHAAVVGGGLAGSLLALHLAQLGHNVDVFEKRADLRSSEAPGGRSINLAISRRGLSALDRVGLREMVLPLTIPMRGRMIHSVNGDTHLQPYSQNPDEFIRSVSRAELNRLLLQATADYSNVKLHFEAPCHSFDPINGLAHMASGKTVSADVLFGTDGAGSVVRGGLESTGQINSTTDFLEHGYKELTIKPDTEGNARLELEALHIWPRGEFMLIALPNLDASFTCTLFMPLHGPVSFEALGDPSAAASFLEQQFPDACTVMPDAVDQFTNNAVGTLGTVRCTPWVFSTESATTCLLGDAAHAVVPFFGQGMNCAFEDCTVLRQILDAGPVSWKDALWDFSESRIPNANAIADMALENYAEMRDHVNDPGFGFRRQVGFELERRFPGRFVPRYSMVSFHTTPYSQVRDIGLSQQILLARLTAGKSDMSEINWDAAEKEIRNLTKN